MQDFWEAMGRLVMDEELRRELFATFRAGPAHYYGTNIVKWTAQIPGDPQGRSDYDKLRKILHGYMPNTPWSLMALGSMLFSLTLERFQQTAEAYAILLAKKDIDPEDDGFYVALGALIVDRNLSKEMISGHSWRKFGFGFVHRRDRRTLASLFDPNKNFETYNAAAEFCKSGWPHECYVSILEWAGHEHPISMLYPRESKSAEE